MTVALVKSPSLFAEKRVGQEGGSEMEIHEHVVIIFIDIYTYLLYVVVNGRNTRSVLTF